MHSTVLRGWLTRKKFNLLGKGKPICGQNIRENDDLDKKEQETKVCFILTIGSKWSTMTYFNHLLECYSL